MLVTILKVVQYTNITYNNNEMMRQCVRKISTYIKHDNAMESYSIYYY